MALSLRRDMQSFSFSRECPGVRLYSPSLFSFLSPIRRKCHRLILGNVTSGKLEHEYIAREGTPLLCDSRREFFLRWDSITGAALSSTKDFSEASFRAECATLTLHSVHSRGGGCGFRIKITHTDVYDGTVSCPVKTKF